MPPPAPVPVQAPDDPPDDVSALGLPCGLSLTAQAMPGAMVALDVMDPCAPDARVTVTHSTLNFTARTDAMGLLTLDIPALETPAFFTVRFDDGTTDTTLAGVPDLIDYGRVAISWEEDRGLQLHAFESGAGFGEQGHVWQDAAGSVADALIGTGGFLTLLGDASVPEPRLAQVYTVPRALTQDLALSVEVPVTETNCGQPVRARAMRVTEEVRIDASPVSFVVPGCDAVGEYLLLQNLFRDLRLAAN